MSDKDIKDTEDTNFLPPQAGSSAINPADKSPSFKPAGDASTDTPLSSATNPPSSPFTKGGMEEFEEVSQFFKSLIQDEVVQRHIIQLLPHDVLLSEIGRRKMIEPLLNTEQVAEILDLSIQGLYKKLQNHELGIPYVPLGRGGGYKFDPKDVREYIEKKKVHPVKRPDSFKKKVGIL